MRKRAAVAVEILVRLVIVVLLDPHHHAVTHERAHAAGMRVVGRTDVGEGRAVAVLAVIDALPGPVRILAEGVAYLNDRLQRSQGQRLVRNCERYYGARACFHELP